jgi:ATP-dependent DNA helicase RecG
MTKEKKESVMKQFLDHEIDILVATSVVEVGVNVPNATTIIIEGAERFGLAQLHQLRGRVIRGTHQAYCYLCTDTQSKDSLERLKALEETGSGFELAEKDLFLRGAGELSGGKQWGISDIGMEALRNPKLVEFARNEARALVENDPRLEQHTDLKEEISRRNVVIHFE